MNNSVTNPLRYSALKTLTAVHSACLVSISLEFFSSTRLSFSGIGEVWANILHNVYADLVGKYGFSTTAFTDPSGAQGNVVYLHLFIDALKLQPCNPTCKL